MTDYPTLGAPMDVSDHPDNNLEPMQTFQQPTPAFSGSGSSGSSASSDTSSLQTTTQVTPIRKGFGG